jgi:hypothetical protein
MAFDANSVPPPPPMDDVRPTDAHIELPEVSLIGDGMRLMWGMSFRYLAACGVWYGIYRAKDMWLRVDEKKSDAERQKQFKMWALSHAADVGVSMLLVPGRYIVGKNGSRLLFDFTFQSYGAALSKFDLFVGQQYLAYAINRMSPAPGATSDYSFFLWQVPSTLLTGAKLYMRMQKAPKKTAPIRVGIAMGVHFFVRLMGLSLALYLPRSEEELILAGIMTALDKSLEAYLIRSTWPLVDEE